MKGKKFTKNLLGLFFPNRCIFCRQIVASDQHICESCKENHLPQEITREIVWPECPTPILCQSVYAYCGEVKRSILDFKFHGKRENAGFYADVLKEMLFPHPHTLHIDCITDVPLSKKRKQERGYNQSELIARELSCLLEIPYRPVLEKIKQNEAQHTLSAKERQENVQGVYQVKRKETVQHKSILLVDDVVTTGATLGACAAALYAQGAAEVRAVAIAQTDGKQEAGLQSS